MGPEVGVRGDTATAGRAGALANSEITLAVWLAYLYSLVIFKQFRFVARSRHGSGKVGMHARDTIREHKTQNCLPSVTEQFIPFYYREQSAKAIRTVQPSASPHASQSDRAGPATHTLY